MKIFDIFKNKNYLLSKVLLLSVVLLLCIAAFAVATLTDNSNKSEAHHDFATSYVDFFMTDNPAQQYDLLDISVIHPNRDFQDGVRENYKRTPLVRKDHSITLTNTREASEAVLKKINNVYSSYCKAADYKPGFKVDKAYRYNVKIKYKNKQNYNVSFWVVKSGDDLKICTVYEYERSIDRCFPAGMY